MTAIDINFKKKSSIILVLRICVGVSLFLLILAKISIKEIPSILSEINIGLLPAVFIIYWIFFTIKNLRWIILYRSQGLSLKKLDAFKSYFCNVFFGFLTFGQVGDLLRIHSIKKLSNRSGSNSAGLSFGEAGVSVLIERFMELGLFLLVGGIGLIFLLKGDQQKNIFYFVLALSITYAAIIYLLTTHSSNLQKKIKKIESGRGKILSLLLSNMGGLFSGLTQYSAKGLIKSVLLTVSAWLTLSFNFFLIALMMDIHIQYVHALILCLIINLINMIPVTIAGFGTRELALIYCLSFYGIPPEKAVVFSLLLFLSIFFSLGTAIIFIKTVELISTERNK